ncbi:MAG: hypothetical protein R3350_09540 [Saprospiraceae bacterium]|nr:hypothetical protein [Saprospiraceae bacterium]
MERKYDLEERLIKFAVKIIDFTSTLPNDYAGNHLKTPFPIPTARIENLPEPLAFYLNLEPSL